MDMEIDDYNIDSDPIQNFLQTKLDLVKNLKEQLTLSQNNNKKLLSKLQENSEGLNSDGVEIKECWKKVYDGKFIIGIPIYIKTTSTIQNINILMQWKPLISPIYTIKIYNEPTSNEIFSDVLSNKGLILIVIENIDFIRSRSYNLNHIISYEQNSKNFQAKLPSITLDAKDVCSKLEIKIISLLRGNLEDFLSCISCLSSSKIAVSAKNESLVHFETCLAVDCMFRETSFDENMKCFIVDGISDVLNGCILQCMEADKILYLKLYYRNKKQFHHLLHYLHQNIRELKTLPIKYALELVKEEETENPMIFTQAFVTQKPKLENPEIRKFGENLQRQINAALDFTNHVIENKHLDGKMNIKEEYKEFRKTLSDLELKTDILHEKVCNKL